MDESHRHNNYDIIIIERSQAEEYILHDSIYIKLEAKLNYIDINLIKSMFAWLEGCDFSDCKKGKTELS